MRKQDNPPSKEVLWKAPSGESDARPEASKPSVEETLARVIDRYNNPKIKKNFRGWVNALVFHFPDIGESYTFKINGDEGIELNRGDEASAAVRVTIPSDDLANVLGKNISPIKAYSSGNLVVKGVMKDLMQMRKLLF
nr:SCP2 sterol-binding domain-containing protein [Candidatus Sigynarchaeum springense]